MEHARGVTSLCEMGEGVTEKVTGGPIALTLNTGSQEAEGGFLLKYEGEYWYTTHQPNYLPITGYLSDYKVLLSLTNSTHQS